MGFDSKLKQAFIDNISERLKKADWWYDYSDDRDVRRRGSAYFMQLQDDLHLLSGLKGGLQDAKNLWKEHSEWQSTPKFLQEVNQENKHSVLQGTVHKNDAIDIIEALTENRDKGNRFVAFKSGLERITASQFVYFTNALDARTFASTHSEPDQTFIACSVKEVLSEVQRVLQPDYEKALIEVAGRLNALDREANRSKGMDFSK